MMAGLAEFMLGIIGCSLFVGILGRFPLEGNQKKLLQLLSGVLLTLAVLRPVVHFDWSSLSMKAYLPTGEDLAAQGQAMTADAAGAIIKSRTEAYILDKAAALDADLEVRVELDDEHIPVQVTLDGSISPYARTRLSKTLEEDLGIPKERQQWKNG